MFFLSGAAAICLSVFGAGSSGGHPQSHKVFAVVCSLHCSASVWHSSLPRIFACLSLGERSLARGRSVAARRLSDEGDSKHTQLA